MVRLVQVRDEPKGKSTAGFTFNFEGYQSRQQSRRGRPLADIDAGDEHVCFWGQSDIKPMRDTAPVSITL